jgi:XRE family transcriptional regulator, aerobic/anaerobic benzoate catabolism transcriptional regulator
MSLEILLKSVGQNVASLRKTKPLTQKNFAQLAGISYRYFQNIEGGRANITLSTLFRLAQFLAVHPSDLIPRELVGSKNFTRLI